MGETGTKICSYILALVYIGSGIGLLVSTIIIHVKTEPNPLSEPITDEEIDKIVLANNRQNDYDYSRYYETQNLRGKKNLRVLMDYDICNEYIQKIIQLKKEEKEYRDLNDVFKVDVVFLASISYIFAFFLVVVLIYLVYLYLVIAQLICLAHICLPCFTCFLYLLGLAYIFLFIVLIVEKYDKDIKNFAEFTDCPNVNNNYLKEKYSNIINLGTYLNVAIYLVIANMIATCCLGYASKKSDSDDSEYLLIKVNKM